MADSIKVEIDSTLKADAEREGITVTDAVDAEATLSSMLESDATEETTHPVSYVYIYDLPEDLPVRMTDGEVTIEAEKTLSDEQVLQLDAVMLGRGYRRQ
jgi:hypothetical protein